MIQLTHNRLKFFEKKAAKLRSEGFSSLDYEIILNSTKSYLNIHQKSDKIHIIIKYYI